MKQIIIDNISTSYYITEDGKCYNSNTNKFLKGQVGKKNGYLSYSLTLPDGSKKRCYAHRLVLLAYQPTDDKKKNQVNHIDGNKLNNSLENLEWVTSQENSQHAISHGLKTYNNIYCFNKEKQLIAIYKSQEEAVRAGKISTSQLHQALIQEKKVLACGFYWSFEPELKETKEYKNTGKAKVVYQYSKEGTFITSYSSTGEAGRAIGGKSSHISECCRGSLKSYKGFIWKYQEDIVSTSGESQREVCETS